MENNSPKRTRQQERYTDKVQPVSEKIYGEGLARQRKDIRRRSSPLAKRYTEKVQPVSEKIYGEGPAREVNEKFERYVEWKCAKSSLPCR
ncbi:hypothetical protein EVAR_86583_1 [Eumeta japonica]|uniref:Uncharacterized protein n=1 Tax=Eumeta variegata TaxID=151549 RepID=A0A4C1W2Q8_EUMVA|nr:hypothetical protein EVAR_86583_1 [Eumeta japonica]